MTTQTVPMSTQNVTTGVARPLAKYAPNIWGDRFLSCPESTEMDSKMEKRVEELKEEIKRKINIAAAGNLSEILNLIDLIQRLGVSYHFESEIDEALRQVMNNMNNSEGDKDDLYMVALRFRLLRQQGFNVSCDVFNNLRDENGCFKKKYLITKDVRAILSLYEASHLRVHGEDILEEALAFTTTYLESMVLSHDLSPPLSAEISLALRQPIRKSVARLKARQFFPIYQEDASHDQVLLEFAELDFNLLQKLHQKELSVLSRWWKDLDFAKKLPFARNRLVECYVWIVSVYFEPQYSWGRKMLVKVIAITSAMDDIYDSYGTPEELLLLTDALERWDIGCMNMLPDYLRVFYKAMLDAYEEMERELSEQGRLIYGVQYSKEEMKKLARAYLAESKWLNKNYIPTVDEYLSISLPSSAYLMLIVTSFIGMGDDIVTRDAFDWAIIDVPKIIRASSIICRLMDDIAGHEFEQEREHAASSVECYMNQYGVSEKEACDALNKMVEDAWLDINEEWIKPNYMPMPLLARVHNFACVIHLLYKDGDEYTHSGKLMRSCVASLFIDPVPMS